LTAAGLGAAACGVSPSERAVAVDIPLPIDRSVTEATVPRNATLETILRQHELSSDLTSGLVEAVRGVFDPRRIRVNQTYRITRSLDGFLREFRYEIDADRFLRVISTYLPETRTPSFEAEVVEYPREVKIESVFAGISTERPSLSAALEDQGENIYLALKLADAFSGLVDFNSDLQDGDQFKALFERVYRNGEPSGYGELHAAVLQNDGRTFTAIPFDLDGKVGWYDAEGRSLKRQFLKSPLRFQASMSSGYGNRRHPVTGNFALHPAIDYRAAYGEPVIAIASGRVASAAYSGNSGRLVVIRHDGGYESMYLHLSRFAVSAGARVQQGDVIGYVGNSGRVTGTHLDFRIRHRGRYINPLHLFRSLPPGNPIPASRMADFEATRDRLLAELDRQAQARPVPGTRAANDDHHD
jgi:murein DD-endopeptidase MepM/ murein hydrolase activator NlpD